jgi:hypothetical protein
MFHIIEHISIILICNNTNLYLQICRLIYFKKMYYTKNIVIIFYNKLNVLNILFQLTIHIFDNIVDVITDFNILLLINMK